VESSGFATFSFSVIHSIQFSLSTLAPIKTSLVPRRCGRRKNFLSTHAAREGSPRQAEWEKISPNPAGNALNRISK